VYQVARIIRELDEEDIKVLRALEDLTYRFEYVPVEEVAAKVRGDLDDVLFRLSRLNKRGLARRWRRHYLGYKLTRAGFDVLALHALSSQDIIISIGRPYGVGKEANVYRALDGEGREVAVKFLRWGRTSFRQARRLRSLTEGTRSFWMDYCKQAAEREFTALRILSEKGVRVPCPIALSRHVLVMERMEGVLLLEVDELSDPALVLNRIISQVRIAFQKARIIHGDLSEYNIMIDGKEQVTLFDWPQWQPTDHPNALWLLRRDVSHVLRFFKRKFNLSSDLQLVLQRITGRPAGGKKG